MRLRFPLVLAVLSASVLPATALSAQDFERPSDWRVRFDQPGATEEQLEQFVEMPPGWHVTSGPAGIYWHPEAEATGSFRVEMEVYLFDPGERREAFGIFIGGRNLDAQELAYTYFLIRNGGQFIVKHRDGSEAPTIEPWTGHEAILSYSERGDDASVRNVLTVEADDGTLRFLVNGREVWRGPRDDLAVDGAYGFRVNHGLNLHISRLEMTPLG
ncbi:MAG: hypothetical protein U5R14_02940 [Gemmatimonadota bacterium]|nr:hypothetical protein [Gemmatimonadota bacterium]